MKLRTILALFLLALPAAAQQNKFGNISAASASCVESACVSLALANDAATVNVQLTGTWSATLQTEKTTDGSTWVSAGAEITANGVTTYNIAANSAFRIRASSYSSGLASVTIRQSAAISASGNPRRGTYATMAATVGDFVGQIWIVTDATTTGSCSAGGGTAGAVCEWDGATWVVTSATGSLTGSGTTGAVPKFTAASAIGDSVCTFSGANLTCTGSLTATSFATSGTSPGTLQLIIADNEGVTGTTVNKLAKLSGAPSKALIAATTDTGGMLGIVVSGAGITGQAQIALAGVASCVFDSATTAGNYVQNDTSTAGNCMDAGATYPSTGQVIGRVLSTNGGAGSYTVLVFGPEVKPFSGYIQIDPATCVGAAATQNWDDDPTLTEPAVACVTPTGSTTTFGVANFDDATDEGFQVKIYLPADWPNTATLELGWYGTATTGGVMWAAQTGCAADAEVLGVTFNAVDYFTADAAKGTTLQFNTASKALTTTGCAAGELMFLRIFRDGNGTGGTDDFSGDASLVTVRLKVR